MRTDEVRMGLAELAHAYRDALLASAAEAAPGSHQEVLASAALTTINEALDALVRNPNEELLLQSLLLRLPPGR
ncbi:hypothetical protein BH24ACT4_BH24ACT4_05590 [soil metagenome]